MKSRKTKIIADETDKETYSLTRHLARQCQQILQNNS